MDAIHSYSEIFTIGHRCVQDILGGNVTVQEKYDGSQISFGMNEDGHLLMRSKNAQIDLNAPGMFERAVASVQAKVMGLVPGHVYRGEYLKSPKHNALAYSRVPTGHIVLYDIDQGEQCYASAECVVQAAKDLGFESAHTFFVGEGLTVEQLEGFIKTESSLGGTIVEGVVIKDYNRFGRDKKALMAKLVRQDFKEINATNWKAENPTRGDLVERIILRYRTNARWQKAVQHLRDAGELVNAPQDIPALMKEVEADVLKECEGEIKDILFEHFRKDILRGVRAGLPEWYKEQLGAGG